MINNVFFILQHKQLNNYDHHAAIYLLLLERLRTRSVSQENNIGLSNSQLNGTQVVHAHSVKHPYPTLEQQRRRPSSIAEQAMRKLGISNNHCSIASSTDIPLEAMPSLITLRDTSIREQTPSPSATISSTLHYLRDSNGGLFCTSGRERSSRDFHSPYGPYGSSLATRENIMLSRDIGQSGCYPNRSYSNRLLMTNGLDQRIIKQSTEDCRRLLQQVHMNLCFWFIVGVSSDLGNETLVRVVYPSKVPLTDFSIENFTFQHLNIV